MNARRNTLVNFIAETEKNFKPSANPAWIESLKETIGAAAVLTDEETIIDHSYDTWPACFKWKNQGKRMFGPDVVVKANSTEQVSEILKWADDNKVPVTPYGGGSSVTGQALPAKGGIALDTTAMTDVIALDENSLMVKVQCGKFGHKLEAELNERGYTLNHSPQSLDRSTVAGWVATRAMGQLSSRYGGIEDLVVTYTAVMPGGEIIETMNVPRAAMGPDLRHIFMGSEGTLGVVTDVTLKIFPLLDDRILEAITFDSVQDGVDVMRIITREGLKPALVRYYDFEEAKHAMQDKEFDKCVMFLGFEGVEAVAKAEYEACMDICAKFNGKKIGPDAVEAWRGRRYDFSTVENLLKSKGGLAETIEIAHFWHGIMDTYTELKEALKPYAAEVLGHFSHVYPQGTSLYIILLGQEEDDATAEKKMLEIWDVAMSICVKHGACLSHHHGGGLARLPYVKDTLGSSWKVLERVKKAIDPNGIMNPGKLDL
ncbi:FAD-binding oxidoreductase [Maridesulfovibrio sp.]|uniref:FAD-binding oxidoreductase n=1 Tax=unclassified Maridesulfovibrio TaxID=2794999 RepID=UPI003B0024EA